MATVAAILDWCAAQGARVPKPSYCTGPSRFGPSCYDCSGFTYMAYKSQGLTIPADSASVARWGRANGLVFPYSQARPGDLLVHDAYGDPYNSTGPRGHIGIQAPARGMTWESAGGKKGVGCYPRSSTFWAIAVRHPAFAGQTTEVPDLLPDERQQLFEARADAMAAKDYAISTGKKVDALVSALATIKAEAESAKNYAVRIDRLLTDFLAKQ